MGDPTGDPSGASSGRRDPDPAEGPVGSAAPAALAEALRDCSYADAMTQLYHARYSGALTLHFANGQPRVIEIPAGVRIRLRVPSAASGGVKNGRSAPRPLD